VAHTPEEYASRVFDYDSQAGLRWDGVQAVAHASDQPDPVGIANADIDDYISELERRTD